MLTIRLEEMLNDKDSMEGLSKQVWSGAIFIYPTDTVYGIGCNAEDEAAVRKVRRIKGTDHPFSVIAPSKEWISENLETNFTDYLSQFPGPITLIMKKRSSFLDWAAKGATLGVRMPDHPFMKLIELAGVPFITTSANKSGEPTISGIREIPRELEREVDFAIDGGPAPSGKPSKVIDLTGYEPKVLRE
jgi:L-threonylcarbamoyladenylate synthase